MQAAALALKVGELARQTGLTVRTLHYYDEINLVKPSLRSESGHRLYTVNDLARLQQVKSLRQLGFSLEEIKELLTNPTFSPVETLQLHLAQVRHQLELQQQLYDRLELLVKRLCSTSEPSIEELIRTIEVITMTESGFTPEQMAEIKERGRQLGEEHIRQVEAEWPQLIARMKAEMEKGSDPANPTVQTLAKRWRELVSEFTGGNPEIQKVLNNRYQHDTEVQKQTGIDPQLYQYVVRAMSVK